MPTSNPLDELMILVTLEHDGSVVLRGENNATCFALQEIGHNPDALIAFVRAHVSRETTVVPICPEHGQPMIAGLRDLDGTGTIVTSWLCACSMYREPEPGWVQRRAAQADPYATLDLKAAEEHIAAHPTVGMTGAELERWIADHQDEYPEQERPHAYNASDPAVPLCDTCGAAYSGHL